MDATTLDPRLREAQEKTGVSPLTPSSLAGGARFAPSSSTAIASPTARHQQQQQQQQQHQASPPTPYGGAISPQTPGSAHSATPGASAAAADPHQLHDDGTPGSDAKKPRACESCRGLKVRCEFDPPDAAVCRRCSKAGRPCIVTQPTRKRQKKTDSRVAELEKKIDALTATLHASRGGPATAGQGGPTPTGASAGAKATVGPRENGGGAGGGGSSAAIGASPVGLGVPPFGRAGWPSPQPRERAAPPPPPMLQASSRPTYGSDTDSQGGGYQPSSAASSNKRKFEDGPDDTREAPPLTPMPPSMSKDYVDIVDKGFINMNQAAGLFARYTDQMAPHLPGVVFPAGTKVADIRKEKPILFLAIMAASSAEYPSIQKKLVKELMEVLADKVIVVGGKSLELVQALQVAVMWYWPPEHYEELKFYQLVHIAAVMAIDIGLGRKKAAARGGFRKHIPYNWRDQHFKKNPLPDPNSIEARRAWLVCYFLATNTSMALHRPNLIRWTPFMTECTDILESSPEAAPTDKYLSHLVWTHRMAEDVGIQFSMDDPSAVINISDARTQYALRGFERDLEKYSSSIPEDMLQPTLKLSFHVLSLYMHEIATQSEAPDELKQPVTADNFREVCASPDTPLTPAHINALSACLTAIDGIFEVFLSLDVARTRCLPVFNFVRVAYAVVVLIKMYFAASSPNSELGKVINKDNMKVEQHLEALLSHFKATAADDRNRPAAKFLVVLVMLKSWMQKQNQPGGAEAGQEPDNQLGKGGPEQQRPESAAAAQQPQQPNYSTTANTPLQLLSEIATNESTSTPTGTTTTTTGANANPALSANPSIAGDYGTWFNSRGTNQPQQQQQQQPFMYDPSDTSWMAGLSGVGMGGVGSLGAGDLDYAALGDGFAQAMDLTLAGLTDGSLGMGLENGMRYVMQDPPFFPTFAGGMGGGGGAGGGGGGGGGGYQF